MENVWYATRMQMPPCEKEIFERYYKYDYRDPFRSRTNECYYNPQNVLYIVSTILHLNSFNSAQQHEMQNK